MYTSDDEKGASKDLLPCMAFQKAISYTRLASPIHVMYTCVCLKIKPSLWDVSFSVFFSASQYLASYRGGSVMIVNS